MDLYELFDSSSEDDDIAFEMMYDHYQQEYEEDDPVFRSRTRKVSRNRTAGHNRLYNDYFAPNCVYNDVDFERRFRMNRNTFLRITSALEDRYNFFSLTYVILIFYRSCKLYN